MAPILRLCRLRRSIYRGEALVLSFQVLCSPSTLYPLWNNLEEQSPGKFIAHDNLKGDQALKQKFIKIHSYSVLQTKKNVQSPQHQAMNSIPRSDLREDQILALPPKRFFCFYSSKRCIYYITSPEQSFETPNLCREWRKPSPERKASSQRCSARDT